MSEQTRYQKYGEREVVEVSIARFGMGEDQQDAYVLLPFLRVNDIVVPVYYQSPEKVPAHIQEYNQRGVSGNLLVTSICTVNNMSFETIPLKPEEYNEIYPILENSPPLIEVQGQILAHSDPISCRVVSLRTEDYMLTYKKIHFELEEVK